MGCEGEKYDELIDGVGGGDIDVTDASLETTKVWPVKKQTGSIAWTVWSTDVIKGSHPAGSVAKITGVKSHNTSFEGQVGMFHTETGNSVSITQQNTLITLSVTAYVTIQNFGSGAPFTGNATGNASALFP